MILIKLLDYTFIHVSRLTHPQMIPEQPLSINLPALHSTPCAQCQHGEESIDKEFDPGVICLHYTIFSRTMTFSLLSHHKTFKCSQVWHSVWGAQSVWARNVMCGRGEGGSLQDHSTRDHVSRAESNWWNVWWINIYILLPRSEKYWNIPMSMTMSMSQ